MTYQETLDYMFARLPMFTRVGSSAYKKDLNNTLALCEAIGNPQKRLTCIHIAGTNGKGSVSHLLASILQEAGYKTALYTSPHLKDFRERIKINGEVIPEKNVINFIEKIKPEIAKIEPSFFELTFTMALDYFANENVEIAVIETGLGGRLDSTNVINPILSIVTNIGFDHVEMLGDTLEKIAIEKAGIIKKNIPVIIGKTQPEIQHVFIEKAQKENSKIEFADNILEIFSWKKSDNNIHFEIKNKENKENFIVVSTLAGNYQKENFITVYEAAQTLKNLGINITKKQISDGFKNIQKNTGLQGRWQILGTQPLIICDTGHNEDGIKQIISQINEQKFEQLHFVLGMVKDKEIEKILSLLPKNATYYFCKANIPRGLEVEILNEKAKKSGLSGNSYANVSSAYEAAKNMAKKQDLIFIGGSTFTVAEVL